ncbi:sigma 54-interacting transcriptional regulator, partial [Candidatus Poribacteria bacterium]|nr:sigma 54-interacting transcriptional regulator [Candidatus Poribacteria bacterium]
LLDLQGRDVTELTHPSDLPRVRAALAQLASSPDATLTLQTRVRHRDGAYRHVEVVASNHLTDPSIEGIVLNLQDITDSITAEHRQDIFLGMLGDLDVSTVVLQRDRFIHANPAFCRLSGYAEEALQEIESAFDIIVAGASELRRQLARRMRGHVTKAVHECTLRREDGQDLDIEVTFRAGDAEEDAQIVGIVQDITERKEREASLRARAEALETQVGDLQRAVARKYDFEGIVGKSPAMKRVYTQMEAAIDSGLTVLITGPTGAGKELIAKAIHYNSPRGVDQRPPTQLNCGAVPRDLIASTLFGHRRGAFTGADRDAVGLFEAASGGTLILDEIGEMAMDAQINLLRVLEERAVLRLGETTTRDVDVRVIAITNRDLPAEIGAGRFREDLYYRLRVLAIQMPSLADRREDIPKLAERFLAEACEAMTKALVGFTSEAVELLDHHPWPGNIRELQNAVHSAAAFAPAGGAVDRRHFPAEMTSGVALTSELKALGLSYKDSVALYRRRLVEDALRACDGNRTRAAGMLSMQRTNLVRLVRELGVSD